MKILLEILQEETRAQLQAKRAIQYLYQWAEGYNPVLAAVSTSLLIKQCLSEISQERASHRNLCKN